MSAGLRERLEPVPRLAEDLFDVGRDADLHGFAETGTAGESGADLPPRTIPIPPDAHDQHAGRVTPDILVETTEALAVARWNTHSTPSRARGQSGRLQPPKAIGRTPRSGRASCPPSRSTDQAESLAGVRRSRPSPGRAARMGPIASSIRGDGGS